MEENSENSRSSVEKCELFASSSPLAIKLADDVKDFSIMDQSESLLTNQVGTSISPKTANHLQRKAIEELYSDPYFAVICSFFNKFGVLLGMKPQSIDKLAELLTNFHKTGRIDRELIDLHLTLLRKLNFKSARADAWEKHLMKFCWSITSLESEYLLLERIGYLLSPVSTKLSILKTLCECQFDMNSKFKENIFNSCRASDLRLLPVGYDKNGLAYWYQQDAQLDLRVYREEPDDHSGGSWSLIATSKFDLETLIESLLSAYGPDERTKNLEMKSRNDMKSTSKKGTFLDCYQDRSIIKKKDKGTKGRKKEKVFEEQKIVEENEQKIVDDQEVINDPADYVERRILPRRSARSAAITHLKELTSSKFYRSDKNTTKLKNKESSVAKAVDIPHVENKESSVAKAVDIPHVVTSSKNYQKIISEENENKGSGDDSTSDDEDPDENDDEDAELCSTDTESNTDEDEEFMPPVENKKTKRGRRRRSNKNKKVNDDIEEDDVDSDEGPHSSNKKTKKQVTEETRCMRCDKSTNPEILLLCDMCDDAWHTTCLRPLLWFVPDDDWFCPKCQHSLLIEKFSFVLSSLNEQIKTKAVDDKKKQAAAERLRREMEYIGVSLNNIIPSKIDVKNDVTESSSDEDAETKENVRKSKKRAMIRLNGPSSRPIMPLALSRTRRHVAKIDYNFGAFDNLIQEAVGSIDGASETKRLSQERNETTSADRTTRDDETTTDENSEIIRESKFGKPARSHRRLNDLELPQSDSDSDEYQASQNGSEISDPSEDSDEYIPSEEESRRMRSKRKMESEDDFVVSGSESDIEPFKKKRKKSKGSEKKASKKSKRRARFASSDDDSTSDASDFKSDESSDESGKKRRRVQNKKWAPRASSSEESDDPTSISGRPLRRAARKALDLAKGKGAGSDEDSDDTEEEEDLEKGKGIRSDEEEEFKPDEDDEEDEEEEEDEDDEEEDEEDEADENIKKEKELINEKKAINKSKGNDRTGENAKSLKKYTGRFDEKCESDVNDSETGQIDEKKDNNKSLDVDGNKISLDNVTTSVESSTTSDRTISEQNLKIDESKIEANETSMMKNEIKSESSDELINQPDVDLPKPPSIDEMYEVRDDSGRGGYRYPATPQMRGIPEIRTPSPMQAACDRSSLNPSTFMQQMANLASSSLPIRYQPPTLSGPPPPPPPHPSLMHGQNVFPRNTPSSEFYSGYQPVPSVPSNFYNLQNSFIPAPRIMGPSYHIATGESWQPYGIPSNMYQPQCMPQPLAASVGGSFGVIQQPVTSVPMHNVPTTLPVSETDSLSNALASAMDY